jgi:glycosyltransferase involved in cell wall biosynthesis
MKISVIIPCRNERGHICEFLESVLTQDLEAGWQIEILVADGLSDDGTRAVLRQYTEKTPAVRVIDNPGLIVSTGLNAAIGAATGDVIIRMDAHTTYARDYIRECVSALQDSGADNVGGPWVAEGQGLIGEAIAAAFRSPFCTGGGKAHDANYEGEIDTVYLGCWARSVFERVGLFDPGLVRNQDDEFNFRLRRLGGRIWQSPRIKSFYTPRASLLALFRQYLQYGFWKVAVIRKHRSLASWRHAAPALFVSSILLSLALIALASALGMSAVAVGIGTALAAGLSVYFLACVAAALLFARVLNWRTLLILPGVIAVYHVAYGLGFLTGVLKFAMSGSCVAAQARLFTALTR